MEERSVQISILYERPFSLVFWEEKWLVGATPFTWNFGSTGPHWNEIAEFQPIFARSSSGVTPSEKSSINNNRKSTKRFQMSPSRTSYVLAKPPQKGAQKSKVSKIWTISYMTPKRYEIGCQLLLITNRESHTGFRLVPTSMTLNDLNAVIALILRFFSPKSTDF